MTHKLCPICSKPVEATTKPFCSVRCKEVDLGRWFTEGYTVPVVEFDDITEEMLDNLQDE